MYFQKNTSTLDVKVARIDLTAGGMVGDVRHFSQGFRSNPGHPEWSADGTLLSYRVEGGRLAIRSVDTGRVDLVPHRLDYVFESVMSPDGKSIAARGRDGKGRSGIFQVDVRTGESKLIASGPAVSPKWSRDGKKLFCLRRSQPEAAPGIREHDLATGADREVFKVSATFFDLSPDGRSFIVWINARVTDATSSILLVPIDGGPARAIFSMPASDRIGNQHHTLAWTPDGRGVLLTKKVSGVVKLVHLDVDTGLSRTLDINVLTGGFSLSPDGRSIAFLAGEEGGNEVWAYENLLPARPQSAR